MNCIYCVQIGLTLTTLYKLIIMILTGFILCNFIYTYYKEIFVDPEQLVDLDLNCF